MTDCNQTSMKVKAALIYAAALNSYAEYQQRKEDEITNVIAYLMVPRTNWFGRVIPAMSREEAINYEKAHKNYEISLIEWSYSDVLRRCKELKDMAKFLITQAGDSEMVLSLSDFNLIKKYFQLNEKSIV